MPTQISVSVLFLPTHRTDEHEENMRTINASSSAMQPASEQDDIVNSPNYEDIAVVELQLCISLTVTECDIDSVTGEIV